VYADSADVYDLLTGGRDYAGAVAHLRAIFAARRPDARTLLDIGCGTGRHLEHFGKTYEASGLDLSESMLRVARTRCGDAPLHAADLADFALGARYDLITCLFGSIGFALTPERLDRALGAMADHLAPGGLLAIEPWITDERFVAGRIVNDCAEGPDVKVTRMYVTRRVGKASVFDIQYLVGRPDGVTHFDEHLELGLFSAAEYEAALQRAGFRLLPVDPGPFGYGLYLAERAA
jgi:SAM-dependent methyltransferase